MAASASNRAQDTSLKHFSTRALAQAAEYDAHLLSEDRNPLVASSFRRAVVWREGMTLFGERMQSLFHGYLGHGGPKRARSGLSERPHRCRTWAPRGQTPVLHF